MPTVESNFKELMRRGFLWNKNITLDDGHTSLLYDGNPNFAVENNSQGENKLISLLPSSTFYQSNGTWWLKTSLPNSWKKINLHQLSLTTDKITLIEILNIKIFFKDFVGYSDITYENNKIKNIYKYTTQLKLNLKFKKEFYYSNDKLIQTSLYFYDENKILKTYFTYNENNSLVESFDELIFITETGVELFLEKKAIFNFNEENYTIEGELKFYNNSIIVKKNIEKFIYTPIILQEDENIFSIELNKINLLNLEKNKILKKTFSVKNIKILDIKNTGNFLFFTIVLYKLSDDEKSYFIYVYNKTTNNLLNILINTNTSDSYSADIVFSYINEKEFLVIYKSSLVESSFTIYKFSVENNYIKNNFNGIVNENIMFYKPQFFLSNNDTILNLFLTSEHIIKSYDLSNYNFGVIINDKTNFLSSNTPYTFSYLEDGIIFSKITTGGDYIYLINLENNLEVTNVQNNDFYNYFKDKNLNNYTVYTLKNYFILYDDNNNITLIKITLNTTKDNFTFEILDEFTINFQINNISLFKNKYDLDNSETLYYQIFTNDNKIKLIRVEDHFLIEEIDLDINGIQAIRLEYIFSSIHYKNFTTNSESLIINDNDFFSGQIYKNECINLNNIVKILSINHYGNEFIDDYITYRISDDNIQWYSFDEQLNAWSNNYQPVKMDVIKKNINKFNITRNKKINFMCFLVSNLDGTKIPQLRQIYLTYKAYS